MSRVAVVVSLLLVSSGLIYTASAQESTTPSPSSGTTNTAPSCPPGSFWNGQSCQAETQPTSQAQGTTTQQAPPTCPTGQFWNGQYCQTQGTPGTTYPPPCDPSQTSCPPPCPPEDSQCKPPCPPGATCPPPSGGYPSGGYPSGNYPSGSYPSGSYCDPSQTQCGPPPSGDYRPACSEDGYCPPPPQQSCPPGDQYCRPPPPPECHSKFESIRSEMEALMQEFHQGMMTFHSEFEADRRAFSQSQHTPEEWKTWNEGWMAKGQTKADEFKARMEAFMASKDLGDCAQYMPPPPIMGPMGGGGGPPPGERYGSGPPQGGPPINEPEEVRVIREECEAKVMAIWDFRNPPDRNSESTFKGPSPEQQQQIQQIMRDCEKRIRELFQGVYEQKFAEEGGNPGNEHFGSFSMYFDEENEEIVVTGKFLALTGNPNSQQMTDITCGGQTFVDVLEVNGYLENFDFEDTGEGTALKVKASGTQILQLHDNPRCTINLGVGGTISEITLDLADYLDVEETDKGLKFTDGEIDGTVLVHEGDFELGDGNELTFDGKATFLVSNSVAAQASSSSLANDLNVKAALEDGSIGGEVIIASDDGEEKSDAIPYGDLELTVDSSGENEVSVTVDSENEEGKTIVMSLDEEVLAVDQLEDVEVLIWDLTEEDGADEGGLTDDGVNVNAGEVEACTQEADNLQDILDPLNDGDCNEYWVVIDKLGTQVLVSNPHYSAKRIDISSSSSGTETPGANLAIVTLALVLGTTFIAIGLRRRDE